MSLLDLRTRPLLTQLLLTIAYFVTAKAGLLLAIPPGYATAVWPPSGVALATLLLYGNRYAWGVWLGSLITNIAVSFDGSSDAAWMRSIALVSVIASGAAIQALTGSWLIKRYSNYPNAMKRDREVIGFLVLGGPIACLLSASIGVTALHLAGSIPATAIAYSWLTWWVGDSIGVLTCGPLALMWLDSSDRWRTRRLTVTIPLVLTFFAAVIVFVYASRYEGQKLHERFSEDASYLVTSLEHKIELNRRELAEARAIAMANSEAATRTQSSPHTDDIYFSVISPQFVELALKHHEASSRILVTIVTTDQTATTRTIYRSPQGSAAGTSLGLLHERTLQVDGRTWRMRFEPTLLYLAEHKSLFAWFVLALSLIACALFGAGALVLTGRTALVEGVVAERTIELAQSNRQLAEMVDNHIRAERALEIERSFLKAVLENLSDGIVVLNAHGHFSLTNESARQMHSALIAISSTTDPDVPHGLQYPTEKSLIPHDKLPFVRALQGENVRDFEVLTHDVNGRSQIFAFTCQPLRTTSDTDRGIVCVLRDLTESRDAERIKQEFVSTVSHELRTPLTSIQGALGLLSSGAFGQLEPPAAELVTLALRNGSRLLALINDLLDIDKIEAGKMDFDITLQPLLPLLRQSIDTNRGYAHAHQVTLDLHEAPGLDQLMLATDANRFLQVLANLASNAIKFSPAQGHVEVSVLPNTDNVRIEIRDHGPGIPESFRKQIFQKFTQADSSDRRAKGGTGLGLSITKALTEHMGGSIGFETQLGVGTTFYVVFPLAEGSALSQRATG